MLLHIFTKRDKQGKHIETDVYWKQSYSEASKVLKKDTAEGFHFLFIGLDGETWEESLNTKTHGFELKNDKGIVIDRYVTPIE